MSRSLRSSPLTGLAAGLLIAVVIPACGGTNVLPIEPNQRPTANNTTVSVTADTEVRITLTGGDADGTPLLFEIATNPTNGMVTAPFLTGDTEAEVTYAPDGDFVGTDTFTFVTFDGEDRSTPATVTVTVTEELPAVRTGGGS